MRAKIILADFNLTVLTQTAKLPNLIPCQISRLYGKSWKYNKQSSLPDTWGDKIQTEMHVPNRWCWSNWVSYLNINSVHSSVSFRLHFLNAAANTLCNKVILTTNH